MIMTVLTKYLVSVVFSSVQYYSNNVIATMTRKRSSDHMNLINELTRDTVRQY